MKPWKVILATLVIFIAGLVTGAVLARKTEPKRPAPPSEVYFQGPMYIQRHFLNRMRNELALTDQQTANLDKTFANSRERIRILLDIVGPEMQQELDAVRAGIEKELTPEQQEKFEELLRKPRRGRHGGPPPQKDFRRPREDPTGPD